MDSNKQWYLMCSMLIFLLMYQGITLISRSEALEQCRTGAVRNVK